MTNLAERLQGAWRAIQDIKDDPNFNDLYAGIEANVLDGLEGDEHNAGIEALNAYLATVGKASTDGFV